MAIKPTGAKDETFGVVFATARTQVDKVARTVVVRGPEASPRAISRRCPTSGAAYAAELQSEIAGAARTISLDRLEASLAVAGVKPPAVAVKNNPPQVIVSYSPAILVPIDGAPVLKPVPDDSRVPARHQHPCADPAAAGSSDSFYIHVYDGWLDVDRRSSGPWTQALPARRSAWSDASRSEPRQDRHRRPARRRPEGESEAVARERRADDLHEPGADRADRVQGPARFRADRRHAAPVGVEHDERRADQHQRTTTITCCSPGRWFTAAGLTGPWTFVAEQRAAAGFRADSAAVARRRRAADGGGHAAGAGSGDRELDSADGDGAARRTARSSRRTFDGAAAVRARSRARRSPTSANSSVPVIQVSAERVSMRSSPACGSRAAQLTGPWVVATSVPTVIYTIPPSSPIHYVTYVRIYEATPQVRLRRLYAGLSRHRGRRRTAPSSTARATCTRRGSARVVSAAVHLRRRGGAGLQPVRRLHVRLRDGTRDGGVDGAVLGRRVLPPGVLGRLSVLRDGERQRVRPLGQRPRIRARARGTRGGGVAGTTASGNYYNSRTGTSGSYNAGRQYNA